MLTSIDYVAPPGAAWPNLRMYMVPPDAFEPLHIRAVTGLEPVVATVTTKSYGVVDGEFHIGSQVGRRNIVITLGLNTIAGEASVAGGRDLLYRYFLPKNAVKLQLNFSNRDPVEIDGYVESITGDRFTQDPEMQVSVLCPKPNFRALEAIEINGLTGDATQQDAVYIGDTGAGVEFELTPTAPNPFVGDIFLERRVGTGTWVTMDFYDLSLPPGHTFYVNTIQGQKRIEVRPNTSDPVINKLASFGWTSWMALYAADNKVRVRVNSGSASAPWVLRYTDQFVGV